MAELQDLTNKRKQVKTATTRFATFVKNFKPEDNIKILQSRLTEFRPLLAKYNDLQSQIELLNQTEDTNDRDDYEQKYHETLTAAEDLIESKTILTSQNSVDVQLPILPLPHFSGDYTKWTSFYDRFKALIHENKKLENILKLQYLRSALSDEAASTIESLSICAESYETAWRLLKERYQNTRLIVQHHIHALFNLPQLSKSSSTALRELVDKLNAHLESIKTNRVNTENWDPIIIYLVTSKLDYATKREWEASLVSNELPTLSQFKNFLINRCQTLESIDFLSNSTKNSGTTPNKIINKGPESNIRRGNMSHILTTNNGNSNQCVKCKGNHLIYQCPDFLKSTVFERNEEVRKLRLCFNCLKGGHDTKSCRSTSCKTCHNKHNTLLHYQNRETTPTTSSVNHCQNQIQKTEVLLSTALIQIQDDSGNFHPVRVLLDVGSQQHFIRENVCTNLDLKLKVTSIPISGISKTVTNISRVTNVKIKSLHNNYTASIQCLVVPEITGNLPAETFDPSGLRVPENMQLADPAFFISSPVDMLIGAGLFYDLLMDGRIKLGNDKTFLQNSSLGWLIGGPMTIAIAEVENQKKSRIHYSSLPLTSLEKQMEKFWQLENGLAEAALTSDDEICERHFKETYQRDVDGRFIVRLPFKDSPQLGSTKEIATKRLLTLENKLKRNNEQRQEYHNFLREYLELGHMERISPKEDKPPMVYYLPHHAVTKPSSTSTKTRVVFDASAKSSNGICLNDCLYSGPSLQAHLFSIIVRCRLHKFVLSADICKMYRQIWVHPEDRDFQRILFRESTTEPLTEFRLRTVTYGLNCAPYLAMRCLHQLAFDATDKYPQASNAILNCFYMDDLLIGLDSFENAIVLRDQLIQILKEGGFELRKWSSNNENLVPDNQINFTSMVHFDRNTTTKTLGLTWSCATDSLKFDIQIPVNRNITKRGLLSIVAHVFDPIGLLNPFMIGAKILLQKLWQLKLAWDDPLPSDLTNTFNTFVSQLPLINNLQIPRYVTPFRDNNSRTELHGFCDASKQAYGAAIYIRCINQNKTTIYLLCSKSKIAPLKELTIPRLELSAAVLLAKLVAKTLTIIDIKIDKIFLWSDSTITLSWVSSPPSQLEIFVANRVRNIQTLTKIEQWCYVNTKDNPADLITRGIVPSDTNKVEFWFNGPSWLTKDSLLWPQPAINYLTATAGSQFESISTFVCTNVQELPLFNKISSFTKLKRIIAYCLRFLNNAKRGSVKLSGSLKVEEINMASKVIIKAVQGKTFATEIINIQNNKPLKDSTLVLKCFSGQ